MKVFVTQFGTEGSYHEQFGSVHRSFNGAVDHAMDALKDFKKQLEEDPEMKLTIQGPTELDDGSQVIQMVNDLGNEVEFWRITETEVGE